VNGWISIDEEDYPPPNVRIFGATDKDIYVGVWCPERDGFIQKHMPYRTIDISHWMHLPTLPDGSRYMELYNVIPALQT
jgi:hypothetical protein